MAARWLGRDRAGERLKRREFLRVSRSPVELAVMRTLKDTLDPKHVLNPGKILG